MQNMNISRHILFSIQIFTFMGQRMILTDFVEKDSHKSQEVTAYCPTVPLFIANALLGKKYKTKSFYSSSYNIWYIRGWQRVSYIKQLYNITVQAGFNSDEAAFYIVHVSHSHSMTYVLISRVPLCMILYSLEYRDGVMNVTRLGILCIH